MADNAGLRGRPTSTRGVVRQVEVPVELEQLDKASHPAARAVHAEVAPAPASLISGLH